MLETQVKNENKEKNFTNIIIISSRYQFKNVFSYLW